MATVSQKVRGKVKKVRKIRRATFKAPQKKGMCLKVFTRKPKKPNSAQRKVAKVKLSNKTLT